MLTGKKTYKMVRQVEEQCPKCGSWYRDEEKCNKCGTNAPVIEHQKYSIFVSHNSQGKQWSRKDHRYLTHDEIKNGRRGG